jgi:predicted transcriptional regulator
MARLRAAQRGTCYHVGCADSDVGLLRFAPRALMWYIVNIVYKQVKSAMSKSVTIAARVDADLDRELERLAEATGRSKSWLINEALRSYVANEQQFLAAVEEGKQALRAGQVVDHATVVAAFERVVKPHP